MWMSRKPRLMTLGAVGALGLALVIAPGWGEAHPLGNFSISHYAGIRIGNDEVRLRYLIDMAEIPTFQEIQGTGIVGETGHPSLPEYLARRLETLKKGLRLEVNGQRLTLRAESSEIIFPAGAGGLPTLKLGVVYRAPLDGVRGAGVSEMHYRDENFPGRAGWKEIVAVGEPGVTLVSSSVPGRDRSRELTDYPTDFLDSPPQDLEARIVFTPELMPAPAAATDSRLPSAPLSPPTAATDRPPARTADASRQMTPPLTLRDPAAAEPAIGTELLRLHPNQRGTPRNAFTELVAAPQLGPGVLLFALLLAASLGAFHAVEPGHGKTVVAAYLVGSRGTAWHAVTLGLIVTASHTVGVYLLGAVTLYASRYVVPERLYPWLGVTSGLTIAILGVALFLRRYADAARPDAHSHHHAHGPRCGPHHADDASLHAHGHEHGAHVHHDHEPSGTVSLRELLALGVTGGIVPCPAALVVLLSAVALRRIGFGLLLIVAFSIGLAAVLIGIGLLMVHARQFMSRFQGEGRLITRWLPLTSAAVIALSGVVIATQSLMSAGILRFQL
jgi:ABC-type nickel/cobalt efflux system permease component RcnA